jgi:hypothetical protein
MVKSKVQKNSKLITPRGDGPSASSQRYSGSTVPKSIVAQRHLTIKLLSFTQAVSSSAGGVINAVFGNTNPSSCGNWSSLAAVYDEYRVLAMRVHWVPSNGYNKVVATQTCLNPLFVVLDRDSATALTSTGAASGYDSVKMFDLERCFTYDEYKMDGPREASFITTATPTNLGGVLFFATGLSNSLQYGTVLVQFLTQFRAAA